LSKIYGSKVTCASNADVLAKADVLILCVPPDVVKLVLKDVKLREGQVVVSVAAMFAVAELSKICAPACAVRSLPMVSAEFHSSFTLVCFGEDWKTPNKSRGLNEKQVLELFEAWGSVAHAQDDQQLDALGFAGLHQKSMLAFLQSMQLSLQNQGVPPELAAQTVSQQMRAVCDDAVRAAKTGTTQWEQLRERGCRGELNQLVCDILTGTGFFASYRLTFSLIGLGKTLGEANKAKLGAGVAAAIVALGASVYAFFG
jgi:pyrroline-5-carboxylate reductase